MTDHTPQTTGERSPVYDQLIADRAKWVADFEAIEVRHRKNLADIDAAIAAVLARRTPAVGVERAECRNCGGWLVQSTLGPVHDRDGSPACTPGHSGSVAQPLAQTSAFPAVTPWPDVRPGQKVIVHWKDGSWTYGVADTVSPDKLVVKDGDLPYDITPGEVDRVEPGEECAYCERPIGRGTSRKWVHAESGSNLCSPTLDGRDGARSPVATPWDELPADQRGEVSDQTTATPAAGVTVPDEAGA